MGGDDQSCLVCTAGVGDQVVVADVYVSQERDAGGSHIGFDGVDEAGFGLGGWQLGLPP
ncbi:hypothetical protein OIE52_50355 [Streptomyces canus]|uniref:hypothetical protein n=1 Tax=Streptomyces canus TaxID=58343 RepID=UPI0032520836